GQDLLDFGQAERIDVGLAQAQALDARSGRSKLESVGCFVQDLTERSNDFIDALGRESILTPATRYFGECGAKSKNVGFGDAADHLFSEERIQAAVQGGQQRANVAAPPFDA